MWKQHTRAWTSLCVTIACAFGALFFFSQTARAAEQELRILTSTFPIYQITRNVVDQAAKVRVELLIPASSGCPHDYSLSPQDMQKLARADVLVLNGLGMEDFLTAAIQQAGPSLQVIDSGQGIDPAMLITMHRQHHHHRHNYPNPHLFVSPKMNALLATVIAGQLAQIHPEQAALYQSNAQAYRARMQELSTAFRNLGATLNDAKIVTQYEVFDYLLQEMGLEALATIHAHEGSNPSPAELMALVHHISKKEAQAIFIEPLYADNIGATIAGEARLPLAVLDPVSSGPEHAPLDYYEQVMRNNLQTMEQTLGRD